MDKKYLNNKIKQFIKSNRNEEGWKITDWNEEDTRVFIEEWLNIQRRTSAIIQLLSIPFINLRNNIEEIISRKKEEEEKREAEARIQYKLEQLFIQNEDEHIGSQLLMTFYSALGIDYSLAKERIKHSGRISKFRKKLKKINPLDFWLISGKIMKLKLEIHYENTVDGQTYEQIDGWCYTNNTQWLRDFFIYERKKHKDLMEAYENFKDRLD